MSLMARQGKFRLLAEEKRRRAAVRISFSPAGHARRTGGAPPPHRRRIVTAPFALRQIGEQPFLTKPGKDDGEFRPFAACRVISVRARRAGRRRRPRFAATPFSRRPARSAPYGAASGPTAASAPVRWHSPLARPVPRQASFDATNEIAHCAGCLRLPSLPQIRQAQERALPARLPRLLSYTA